MIVTVSNRQQRLMTSLGLHTRGQQGRGVSLQFKLFVQQEAP